MSQAACVRSKRAAADYDLRDGRPHHVAMTVARWSKTGGNLYVDGKVVLTFDPTKRAGSLASNAPLLVGNHPDQSLHCSFKGLIEDVRIYARALTGPEVEALSRVGKANRAE